MVKNTPLEVDRALLDLNLIGTISLTKAVLPHMIDRHDGQVVIVSSILGKFGKVKSLHCNYKGCGTDHDAREKFHVRIRFLWEVFFFLFARIPFYEKIQIYGNRD